MKKKISNPLLRQHGRLLYERFGNAVTGNSFLVGRKSDARAMRAGYQRAHVDKMVGNVMDATPRLVGMLTRPAPAEDKLVTNFAQAKRYLQPVRAYIDKGTGGGMLEKITPGRKRMIRAVMKYLKGPA